jgi:hypothetical protein
MTRAGLDDDVLAEPRENKGDDSVVKLRPVVPANLPGKLRRSSSFGVEIDAMPGGYVCSGSLKHTLAAGDVTETMAVAGRCGRCSRRGSKHSLPTTCRITSSSTTWPCSGAPIFVLKRAYLAERGIDLSGEQQTKTRRALEFFSARLEK